MGRNITVEASIFIAAPPEAVWDYTQDWSRRAEWDPAILAADVVPGDRVIRARTRAGSFTVRYKLYERPHRTSLAMTDSTSRLITGGGGAWRYEPEGQGTRFAQQNTLVIGNGLLGLFLGGPLRWQLRRSTRRALANAKRVLEAR